MHQILTLLFDAYTREECAVSHMPPNLTSQVQFQRLKELAGEEVALEIWDAATQEGAEWEEVCFRAGLRAGVEVALELLDHTIRPSGCVEG